MNEPILPVREIEQKDIDPIINYWLGSSEAHMKGMGVDLNKLPTKEEWTSMLMEQLSQPIEEKKSYAIIWLINGKPIGHCNINKINFGVDAYMHLHIWQPDIRKKGLGVKLVKMTLPYFFKKFNLKKLYCEPYALNPAPNKTLEKIGFTFVKKHRTTPGYINLEQEATLWKLSYYRFEEIAKI